ncbi:hypothetical protein LF41_1267 [Lysobacter dokdonensis DS-58]|uniref:Uncharacterized protein n=1 Tax=Lysobacter dokdonensis DS-58 TaxID=1300345 RepID=A0A0A2WLQ5_9GAMM|nr:hypothetical protein LF41_1267 [Lysobacter dokdonensis DS-58]
MRRRINAHCQTVPCSVAEEYAGAGRPARRGETPGGRVADQFMRAGA